MVLESTMICFDNSEYQRNGDYFSTRLNVQKDGVHLVCLTKLRSNPENNVGLMTMSNSIDVLVTLTNDLGRIFSNLHAVQPKGDLNMLTGVRIAHLVLKHRQGKNHKMRIVAFVGSPLEHDEADLVKLAKRLKKEKVNVDIVSYGEHTNNNELLSTFINALNGKDGSSSHLVSVPRGSDLSDALLSSPIIQGEDGLGGAGLGGTGFEFGVDPNEDPELALALRVSMEEQRQRQEDEQRRALADSNADGTEGDGHSANATDKNAIITASGDVSTTSTTRKELETQSTIGGGEISTEEAMLQRALALSTTNQQDALPDFSNMSEEEQIAFAMQMSMQDATDETVTQQAKRPKTDDNQIMEVDEDFSEVVNDPSYLQNVLENLPGIDSTAQNESDNKDKSKKNSDSTKK